MPSWADSRETGTEQGTEQLVELCVLDCPLPRKAGGADLVFYVRRQQTRPQVSEADVQFQEQLIQEREGEIEQIEQGITELNQIFKDLGQIVGEQQSMIGSSSACEPCPPETLTFWPDRQHRDERDLGSAGHPRRFRPADAGACVSAQSRASDVLLVAGVPVGTSGGLARGEFLSSTKFPRN